jgi:hypothetical protein
MKCVCASILLVDSLAMASTAAAGTPALNNNGDHLAAAVSDSDSKELYPPEGKCRRELPPGRFI